MKDIFLGVGGHGCLGNLGKYLFDYHDWNPFSSNLKNPARDKILVFGTFDSGGATGSQLDILSFDGFNLNKKLHKHKKFPILPFGDLKQFLIFSLKKKFPQDDLWVDNFDLRSNDFKKHLDFIKILENKVFNSNKGKSLSSELKSYFENFLNYYNLNKVFLPQKKQKEICFGNLFLSFLYFKSFEKNVDFSEFLQELNLFPNWLKIVFFIENRTDLQALDYAGNLLLSEEEIDEYYKPINPQTFKLVLNETSEENFELNSYLKFLLKGFSDNENRIFITPGSDANWLGIVNNSNVQSYLKGREVWWFPNNYWSVNEVPFSINLKHLSSLSFRLKSAFPDPITLNEELKKTDCFSSLTSLFGKKKMLPNFLILMEDELRRAFLEKAGGWLEQSYLEDMNLIGGHFEVPLKFFEDKQIPLNYNEDYLYRVLND